MCDCVYVWLCNCVCGWSVLIQCVHVCACLCMCLHVCVYRSVSMCLYCMNVFPWLCALWEDQRLILLHLDFETGSFTEPESLLS